MKISLVGCNGARFKFYLFVLLSSNKISELSIIVYGGLGGSQKRKAVDLSSLSLLSCNDFTVAEIFSFFGRVDNCLSVEGDSINSGEVRTVLSAANSDFAVFCGKSGEIVSRETLACGPPFLHMHPGDLPRYRGSTTMYYSYLLERMFSVTAFFMSADIDDGQILRVDHYDPSSVPCDLDVIGDCFIRSETLSRSLEDLYEQDSLRTSVSEGVIEHDSVRGSDNNIYYVIHPLLKQIAVTLLAKQKGA